MSNFEDNLSDSESNDSDIELQEAFAAGLIKPGLNKVDTQKHYVNNVKALTEKAKEVALHLPWIETLDCINKEAPLAPEIAAQMLQQEQLRENQLKNNKKLPQYDVSEDPVLNDFKRETMFHRQAQATVLEAIPKLKAMSIITKRPDDYFAEMAKSDEHMQKVRSKLMQKQAQQQRSEKVKQLRMQRKEGKALQIQARLERQKEKKTINDQVKKVRKGLSKDTGFLDSNHKGNKSKRVLEKQRMKDKKFGFGGKKKGLKQNTKDSASDINEYKSPGKKQKFAGKRKMTNKRPGKNRRTKSKNKSKK